MKLQLNEKTINAYINEALKQELEEGLGTKFLKGLSKLGKKAAQAAEKKAGAVTRKGGEAFGNLGKSGGPLKFKGNSSRTQAARKALRGANGERGAKFVTGTANKTMGGGKLEYVAKTVKDEKTGKKVLKFYAKDGQTELTGEQLKLARSNFRMRAGQYKDIRKMGNLNRGILLAATGGAIAGSNLGGGNPDEPWLGGGDDVNNENGQEQEEGFEGSFPWDDTEPQWTPRTPKNTTNQPQQPQQQPEEQPQPQQREPISPIEPINANIPAPKVTGATQEQPVLARKETTPTIAQNAMRVMAQTANQSQMSLQDRIDLNNRTAQNAINAIDKAINNGSMSRAEGESQKNLIKQANKTLSAKTVKQ